MHVGQGNLMSTSQKWMSTWWNVMSTRWNTMLTYQSGCWANEMCCQPNWKSMHHHFCKQLFLLLFFQTSLEENLEIHGFFPVSKCLVSFFSKDLQLSEIKKNWRKKKRTTASKTYGHLSSWTFHFVPWFSLFLGALVNIWWARFHQKHWSLKNKSKP